MDLPRDACNALRRRVWPQLHYLIDGTFGGYAVSHTTTDEYVMTINAAEGAVEDALVDLGFARNPISSLKVRLDGNTSDGSWVRRDSVLSEWQLHVVLHAADDETVDVYAHWEYSWITHPYRHYLAREYDAEKGVERARALLADYESERFPDGLPYEDHEPRRQVVEYLFFAYHGLYELWSTRDVVSPSVREAVSSPLAEAVPLPLRYALSRDDGDAESNDEPFAEADESESAPVRANISPRIIDIW
ncbi:hypothetical protein ACNS7O_09170 [Haloferacaceae archaeon DSL9]